MTFKIMLHFMKDLRLTNVSIHRKFNQNRIINECAGKSPLIPEFFKDVEELRFLIK